MHRLYNSYNKTQGHSPFQRQDDFRRGKKKMFMNGYSEESFYAIEISLDFFFFPFLFFLAP